MESTPADWVDTVPPVLALGEHAAPELVRQLRAHPDAPGRQAALCALGALGNRDASPYLIEQVRGDAPYAYEAALALGRLGDPRAAAPLRAVASDPDHDITNRAASACALLDLGDKEHAVPLIAALLVAGTSFGAAAEAEFGLPSRSRWALERSLCIDAIARYTGGDTFGLDEDASWPRLNAGATAFIDYAKRQ